MFFYVANDTSVLLELSNKVVFVLELSAICTYQISTVGPFNNIHKISA